MTTLWDEDMQKFFDKHPEDSEAVKEGFALKIREKALKEEAEALKAKAEELLGPVYVLLGLKKVHSPHFSGSLSYDERTISTYKPDTIKQVLLERGVPASVIGEAIEAGTKRSQTKFFVFRADRKKK